MAFLNKTVWITGASSGIGKALTLELSKQGANLIISSRNIKTLEKVKNKCAYPDKVKTLPLDLNNYSNFNTIVKNTINLFGSIDILINNGGISQRSLAKDTSIKVDEQIMNTNYIGTVALSKELLPYFIKSKNGHFVVITSVVGKIGTPLRSSYAASKHALHGFFDSLRAEIYDDNIKITLACPGFVNTNVSINALIGDGSKQNTLDNATKNGLQPKIFAKRLLKAILKEKHEIVIGGKKEILAVYVKRFFPEILAKIIRKMDVV